jgi:hypothetical protein
MTSVCQKNGTRYFHVERRDGGPANSRSLARAKTGVRFAIMFAIAALVVGATIPGARAVVITDDFSDLNDTSNPSWTHLDGATLSTGQAWDASTGQYHLTAPSNGTSPGVEGFGFVGSNIISTSFTDVRVSADIVDFPNVGTIGSNFAIMARSNNNNSPLVLDFNNALNAYCYEYEPGSNGGTGEIVLKLFWAGGPKDIRSQKVALDNTKDYRFVLEVIGTTLHGQVFNLTDGGIMVAEQFRDVVAEPVTLDHDNNASTPEIPHVPYASGFSGVYAYGYIIASDADVTYDNFRTETAVAGDYNRNGVADGADYVLWRKTQGQVGPVGNPPTSFGDMRANGAFTPGEFANVIDQADYNHWRANFGTSASGSGIGSGSAVPEPVTFVLLLLSVAGFACRRSSR